MPSHRDGLQRECAGDSARYSIERNTLPHRLLSVRVRRNKQKRVGPFFLHFCEGVKSGGQPPEVRFQATIIPPRTVRQTA